MAHAATSRISASDEEKLDDNNRLVLQIYSKTWDEFYEWEQKASAAKLAALRKDPTSRPANHDTALLDQLLSPSVASNSSSALHQKANASDPGARYTVLSMRDMGSKPRRKSSVFLRSARAPSTSPISAKPAPAYEFCTPKARSLLVGDDSPAMRFRPYADDPGFDFAEYASQYDYLSWEISEDDPDWECILLETVRRVHFVHGLSLDDIDSTDILPIKVQSTLSTPGLAEKSGKRDLLAWEGQAQTATFPALRQFPPHEDDLYARLQEIVVMYCPNLNCMKSVCEVHSTTARTLPPPVRPTISNADFVATDGDVCAFRCFRSLTDAEQVAGASTPALSDSKIGELETILSVLPDLAPCELAVMARLPCYQAFLVRPHILARGHNSPTKPMSPKAHQKLQFLDDKASKFTPGKPCTHTGRCSKESCDCFKNGAHCARNCLCPMTCERRWKGCRCAAVRKKSSSKSPADGHSVGHTNGNSNGGGSANTNLNGDANSNSHTTPAPSRTGRGGSVCGTESCACFRAKRECDPEICLPCESRNYPEIDCCRNAQIQQGRTKTTQTQITQWGYGLFLAEDAALGDLIVEYIGELIYEPTVESRDCLATHRQRGYLYDMNSTLRVDASFLGNDARFMNHSNTQANCAPRVMLVNGEHRLGIFARRTLAAGTELLLDYGKEFFTKPPPPIPPIPPTLPQPLPIPLPATKN